MSHFFECRMKACCIIVNERGMGGEIVGFPLHVIQWGWRRGWLQTTVAPTQDFDIDMKGRQA